jgi:anti-sigma B factor antagonist
VAQFQETVLGDGRCSVRLAGEIDLAVKDDLIQRVRASLARAERVDLDFAEVSFIDSSGLGALVLLRKEAGGVGKKLFLVNLTPATDHLLEITGLHGVFDVLPKQL